MDTPPKKEVSPTKQRDWFGMGGRHGIENRTSDLAILLPEIADVSQLQALDIGAAEGDIAVWLSGFYRAVHAIEAMDQVYARLKERAATTPNLRCEQADFRQFQATGPFDHVFFLGVLHYFPDDDLKLQMLIKALGITSEVCFARMGVRETMVQAGRGLDRLHRFTPVHTIREAAKIAGFSADHLDNSMRPEDQRLGDLVLFIRNGKDRSWLDRAKAKFSAASWTQL